MIRRYRFCYTFRAWCDDQGGNVDRQHEKSFFCQLAKRCRHIRLWDLNRNSGKNVLRFMWRRTPARFSVAVGAKYRGFTLGKHDLAG